MNPADIYSASDEVWKPIPGYEGYSASSLGRIRGKSGSVMKPILTRNYPRVTLWHEGKAIYRFVHCLVAEAFIGPRPTGLDVDHKDGNKLNPAVENLEYVTRGENHRRAYRLGLRKHNKAWKRGEEHPTAKLSLAQVVEIRRLYATGQHTQEALGRRFGMAQTQIGNIVRCEHWKPAA